MNIKTLTIKKCVYMCGYMRAYGTICANVCVYVPVCKSELFYMVEHNVCKILNMVMHILFNFCQFIRFGFFQLLAINLS